MMTKKNVEFISWGSREGKNLIIDLLKQGKILISSTDTIYGFLGNCSPESHEQICRVKQISYKKPFLILISSLAKLEHFVDIKKYSSKDTSFLSRCWPGPVTVIFQARKNLPRYLVSEQGTIALRCPCHRGLLSILSHFDGLFSTSANKTKRLSPERFVDIDEKILQHIEYVVLDEDVYNMKDKRNERVSKKPSTIIALHEVDLHKQLPFSVVRVGAYSIEKLKELYEQFEER